MPYKYPNDLPKVAKNWSANEQRRCVSAANAALGRGGSEEDAVYACIRAAGRGRYKQDGSQYDQLADDAAKTLQRYVLSFLEGLITIDELRRLMYSSLKEHYVQMILLGIEEGSGREFNDFDLAWLETYLARQDRYLDVFMRDLESGVSSRDRYLWRAGLYALARPAYIHGSVPQEVSLNMPVLPGDDCLGGSNCHCWLDVEETDNAFYVYWVLDPMSHSCPVCVAHALESPFIFEKPVISEEDE